MGPMNSATAEPRDTESTYRRNAITCTGEPGDPNCGDCRGGGLVEYGDDFARVCVCSKCRQCGTSTFDSNAGIVLGPADSRGHRVCVDCATDIVAEYLSGGEDNSLGEALITLGLASAANERTESTNRRDILRGDAVVFVGTCFQVNDWLAAGGDWAVADSATHLGPCALCGGDLQSWDAPKVCGACDRKARESGEPTHDAFGRPIHWGEES